MDAIQSDDAAPLHPGRGRLTIVFVIVIVAGLALGSWLGNSDDPPGNTGQSEGLVGNPAPEVVITLFDGGTWRLSEHLATDGRPVILNLWASWCVPCQTEIPELSAFARANPGIAVVGAAVNDQEDAARQTAEDLMPSYSVGMDATGRLRDRYPSFGMPFTVIIDTNGVVRHELVGGVTADRLSGFFD